MKTTFFAATMIALIAVSCSKTELSNDTPQSINFSAEVGKGTKAPISGTTYPDGVPFGVFAYALTSGTWGTTSAITNKVMDNLEISYQTDTWKATTGTYYWPSNADTKLSFFAYSPKSVATTPTFTAADGITFTGYTNDGTTDLMYASATDLQSGSVGLVFNHAMAQVLFTVKKGAAYANITFTVKSIKLNQVNSVGTFKAAATSQWSSVGTPVSTYVIYENTTGQSVTSTATAIGNPLVMIPQTSTDMTFTIVYDISGSGTAAETVTKSIKFGNNWERNQKISYNLSLGLNEITFTPSVADWTDTPVTVQ